MKKVILVNTCDAWKTYSSFRFVGIFTNRNKLNKAITDMIKSKAVEFSNSKNDGKNIMEVVKSMNIDELHSNISYLSVELKTLNEAEQ